jgi:hypothetical protein
MYLLKYIKAIMMMKMKGNANHSKATHVIGTQYGTVLKSIYSPALPPDWEKKEMIICFPRRRGRSRGGAH